MQPTLSSNVHDPRALAEILQKAEANLAAKQHPDPYIGELLPPTRFPREGSLCTPLQPHPCLVAQCGTYVMTVNAACSLNHFQGEEHSGKCWRVSINDILMSSVFSLRLRPYTTTSLLAIISSIIHLSLKPIELGTVSAFTNHFRDEKTVVLILRASVVDKRVVL